MSIVEHVRSILSFLGTAKAIIPLVSVVVALVGPRTFLRIPSTTLTARVEQVQSMSREGPQDGTGDTGPTQLLLMIKCYAEDPNVCSQDVVRFSFPGLDKGTIYPEADLRLAPLDKKDRLGRPLHQVLFTRPQKAGETLFIGVSIAGIVLPTDLELQNQMGEDLLASRFVCQPQAASPPVLSHYTCHERITLRDRIAFVSFLKT